MRVLVTGGAGYIGAQTVSLLTERGDDVVIVDDLSAGFPARVAGVPLAQIDLAEPSAVAAVAATMREHGTEAVIHFAARKQVGESMERPAWYYQQNVGSLANLLLAMESADVRSLVFSSSAAVYGSSEGAIDEDRPVQPINPYGATKLVGEQLIAAAAASWPLSAASLRYFNVGGAGRPELGDTEALNLIPIVLQRLDSGLPPVIFGDDYPTDDGTCIRDYIHVLDVADAHLAVLDSLSGPGHRVYNIGTGTGTSVKQMVTQIGLVAGSTTEPLVLDRRPGDPAVVVAVVDRIQQEVGWTARHGLDDIVRSAWESREHFRTAQGAPAR